MIAVDEVELGTGAKHLRVGIFLSVFNVHVNRCPVAGRVVSKSSAEGEKYLAAFDDRGPRARTCGCAMQLENWPTGESLSTVVQITGLIARRIVCHPQRGRVGGAWPCATG